ncbi:hypothetical protein ACOSQ4_012565 [Xanthoceras sorbifolium]
MVGIYSTKSDVYSFGVLLLQIISGKRKISIDRPSMLEVSWMLKNKAADLMTPKKPGFSRQNDHDDQQDVQYNSTMSNLEIGSDNDATVSNLEAR